MSTEILKKETNATANQPAIRPAYEVINGDHAYEVRVALPGVAKADATVTLEDGVLTVEGRRRSVAQDSWRLAHREIPVADYRLRLTLNVRIDEAKISAETRDGILSVQLPVAEEAKPRAIKIR